MQDDLQGASDIDDELSLLESGGGKGKKAAKKAAKAAKVRAMEPMGNDRHGSHASDPDVEYAAGVANAAQFIKELPHGYLTQVCVCVCAYVCIVACGE